MSAPTSRPVAPDTAPPPSRAVLLARNGVAVTFTLNGLAVGSWFSRVPAVREALDLSAGRLGLLLLAMSVGALLAMPTSGLLAQRLGAARTVTLATVLVAVGLTVAGLGATMAGSFAVVALGLVAFGYGSGACDVAMNVEGAAVERRLRRTVMPRFHAGVEPRVGGRRGARRRGGPVRRVGRRAPRRGGGGRADRHRARGPDVPAAGRRPRRRPGGRHPGCPSPGAARCLAGAAHPADRAVRAGGGVHRGRRQRLAGGRVRGRSGPERGRRRGGLRVSSSSA